MPPGFCLDWYAGASASVELYSSDNSAGAKYVLKYTPAFRSTIRPPVEERPLGPIELDPINHQLNQLPATFLARANAAAPVLPAAVGVDDSVGEMKLLGNQLLELAIPQYVQGDLRGGQLFLEIGMDESLLEYPWELMHDGDEFLCLKHAIGRFVNGLPLPMAARQPVTQIGSSLESLSMLLISVPRPLKRAGVEYDPLPEAEAETTAIQDALKSVKGVQVETLIGKNATYNAVFQALNQRTYQIVHFNGHATFNEAKPKSSGLVLFDRDMTTGAIATFFSKRPPIMCFVNGCETAKTSKWKEHYDIFGLARAFLDTGAYLLGSRWKVNDKAAAEFAKRFYTALLQDQESLGTAVMKARDATRKAVPTEFAWASYVLYGDPRVCFRRLV